MFYIPDTRAVWPGAKRGRENIRLPVACKRKFFVCICQTDIWEKTEKVRRSLKQSFFIPRLWNYLYTQEGPHHSMWKYLYPGHRSSCSLPCSPTVRCAESAFWSFPECDNYRKKPELSALWTSSGDFILLIFPWKIEACVHFSMKTSFFRKRKALRQLCHLRLVSSFNKKRKRKKEMLIVGATTP